MPCMQTCGNVAIRIDSYNIILVAVTLATEISTPNSVVTESD